MEDERPIQPMKENDQNIDYISMDKLPVLSADQLSQDNISLNLKNMIETPKWHVTFDAIVFFRSVNKQNSSIIKKIMWLIILIFLMLNSYTVNWFRNLILYINIIP